MSFYRDALKIMNGRTEKRCALKIRNSKMVAQALGPEGGPFEGYVPRFEIGRGNYGSVYLLQHPDTGSKAVDKRIRMQQLQHKQSRVPETEYPQPNPATNARTAGPRRVQRGLHTAPSEHCSRLFHMSCSRRATRTALIHSQHQHANDHVGFTSHLAHDHNQRGSPISSQSETRTALTDTDQSRQPQKGGGSGTVQPPRQTGVWTVADTQNKEGQHGKAQGASESEKESSLS